MGWLTDSGFATDRVVQSKNRGFLTFDATVRELEGLLKTEYHLYKHTSMDDTMIACDQ